MWAKGASPALRCSLQGDSCQVQSGHLVAKSPLPFLQKTEPRENKELKEEGAGEGSPGGRILGTEG